MAHREVTENDRAILRLIADLQAEICTKTAPEILCDRVMRAIARGERPTEPQKIA